MTRDKLDIHRLRWNKLIQARHGKMDRSKLEKNDHKFIHWVMKVLAEYVECPPKGKKWNALAIYMNHKNNMILHDCLSPMVWLDISPKECEDLKDNEYGVDPTAVVEDTP